MTPIFNFFFFFFFLEKLKDPVKSIILSELNKRRIKIANFFHTFENLGLITIDYKVPSSSEIENDEFEVSDLPRGIYLNRVVSIQCIF